MANGSLMKVKRIAECSTWSILQYFWPAIRDNWPWKPIFCLFERGRFTVDPFMPKISIFLWCLHSCYFNFLMQAVWSRLHIWVEWCQLKTITSTDVTMKTCSSVGRVPELWIRGHLFKSQSTWCCVLEQDTFSSCLVLVQTQENAPTGKKKCSLGLKASQNITLSWTEACMFGSLLFQELRPNKKWVCLG